jgi:hypothetical protein
VIYAIGRMIPDVSKKTQFPNLQSTKMETFKMHSYESISVHRKTIHMKDSLSLKDFIYIPKSRILFQHNNVQTDK